MCSMFAISLCERTLAINESVENHPGPCVLYDLSDGIVIISDASSSVYAALALYCD